MALTSIITKTNTSSILKLPLDTRNDPSLLLFKQVVYIPENGIWAPGKKSTPIFDFTSHFDRSSISWFTDDHVGFNEDLMTQAKELAATAISMDEEIQNPSVIFKLSRTHWYNDSKFIVTKPGYAPLEQRQADIAHKKGAGGEINSQDETIRDEMVLAEFSSPLLAYGVTNLSFPANSLHSSHPITIRPINATRRSQSFVQDSVTYAWDVNKHLFPSGGGVLSLYKAIGAKKKIEIGRYQSDNGKVVPGGLMMIDSDEVDVLVAVLTLLSVVSQRDSFSFPTSRYVA